MDTPISTVLEYIAVLAIAILGLGFAVFIFDTSSRWDARLTTDMNNKASSNYQIAYAHDSDALSASEVLTDIMSEDIGISIQINGATADAVMIEKCRRRDATGIQWLINRLTASSYVKATTYDATGNITLIIYKTQ